MKQYIELSQKDVIQLIAKHFDANPDSVRLKRVCVERLEGHNELVKKEEIQIQIDIQRDASSTGFPW